MLHGSETWAISAPTLSRLRRNDRAMIRWMCRAKPQDVCHDTLLAKLEIQDIEVVLRKHRLRWLGHVERSSSWISRVREYEIEGKRGRGRPKLTWDELVKRDRTQLGMTKTDPNDRLAWRGRLRPRIT